MVDRGLRGSASLAPHVLDGIFAAEESHTRAPPSDIARFAVGLPFSRRDAAGYSFVSYSVQAFYSDGSHLRAERRYTDFSVLHTQVCVAHGLPAAFPISSVPPVLLSFLRRGISREEQLERYLNTMLLNNGVGQSPLPTLVAFFRMAPYVATDSPASACLEALPTSTPTQCLAMLRAHPNNEAVVAAGVSRLLELAGSAEDATHAVIDAGAVEWLCSYLRQSTTAQASPSATLSSAKVPKLGDASMGASPGEGLGGAPSAGEAERRGACKGRLDALRSSLSTASLKGVSTKDTAAVAVATEMVTLLTLLDSQGPRHVTGQLMRRCGAAELLIGLMLTHTQDAALQANCAALFAALVATDRTAPQGLSSHYDFEAVALICLAMETHRSRVEVQRHGCGALHALACRSTPLAHEVVRHEGVRLLVRAMSTYRSDVAARMQASVCGAFAALADRVDGCCATLVGFSVPRLIEQVLAIHACMRASLCLD